MTFSSTAQEVSQSHLGSRHHEARNCSLSQAVETRQVTTGRSNGPTQVSKTEARVIKPWAHLVAGGCDDLSSIIELYAKVP